MAYGKKLSILVSALAFLSAAPLSAFELGFEWGLLELCTSGSPNVVPSPAFTLADVPAGTTVITFKLVDHDAPGYDHGGGTVHYTGKEAIAPGIFKYKSPCPPNGQHLYEWQATALSGDNGQVLGRAAAQKSYP